MKRLQGRPYVNDGVRLYVVYAEHAHSKYKAYSEKKNRLTRTKARSSADLKKAVSSEHLGNTNVTTTTQTLANRKGLKIALNYNKMRQMCLKLYCEQLVKFVVNTPWLTFRNLCNEICTCFVCTVV